MDKAGRKERGRERMEERKREREREEWKKKGGKKKGNRVEGMKRKETAKTVEKVCPYHRFLTIRRERGTTGCKGD